MLRNAIAFLLVLPFWNPTFLCPHLSLPSQSKKKYWLDKFLEKNWVNKSFKATFLFVNKPGTTCIHFYVRRRRYARSIALFSYVWISLMHSSDGYPIGVGQGCSQPTTVRFMNGTQTFALSAFTSKQKIRKKMDDKYHYGIHRIHIITTLNSLSRFWLAETVQWIFEISAWDVIYNSCR